MQYWEALEIISERILPLDPNEAYIELKKISEEAQDAKLSWYTQWWASDAQAILGNTAQAIEDYPKSDSLRSKLQTERRLSLKVNANIGFDTQDVLTLFGPKVTKFGREHLFLIEEAIDAIHSQQTPNELAKILREWASDSHRENYSVYIGSAAGHTLSDRSGIFHYKFSETESTQTYCIDIIRKAENMVREERGLPRVNEGWISETKLYYEIRNEFPDELVEQHSSPAWLGRQHLDIFLPGRKVAVEYQGLQHDEPVEYFGGTEAFKKQRLRDARKQTLCKKNEIRLIYVRPGYDLHDVITTIKGASLIP